MHRMLLEMMMKVVVSIVVVVVEVTVVVPDADNMDTNMVAFTLE